MLYFLLFIISEIPSFICLKVASPIIIDGSIDSIWHSITSIDSFTQWNHNEGKSSTESTKVYICSDKQNIYVAFQCFDSEPDKIDIKITPRDYWMGDQVWIMLDTFGDKTTAYDFGVTAGGVQSDDRVLRDGRKTDASWDGVWYSAAKITDYGYNVEMKIPFKTLRFKPGLTEWGINFFRYISRKNESVSWAPLKQSEGIRVSRCGILKGINPGRQGLHLEVYPVGLASYELNSIHPQAGLDFNWCFTSSQLSCTTYPDFAQIEADPYTMNLSKYETYFQERRPFFIESQEVFNTPIKLF
ncbi:MAG: carbohydrate binding family 9 domain-containing protein, partial [Candidatus Stahlbacteria bacterium]|nr:carbohydrate binding family 9 domain-containing protein [Candidatus Stahlbacteria bacterium]